jgi:hypothetical protein
MGRMFKQNSEDANPPAKSNAQLYPQNSRTAAMWRNTKIRKSFQLTMFVSMWWFAESLSDLHCEFSTPLATIPLVKFCVPLRRATSAACPREGLETLELLRI